MVKNQFLNKITFGLLFLWQLPQNIIALCIKPFFKECELLSYDNYCYCYKIKGMAGGISLGSFSFISKYITDDPAIVAHEVIGHGTQSHILGWLYLIVIGIPSFIWSKIYKSIGYKGQYNIFYTEKWANKIAGLEPYGEYNSLRFKN